MRKKEKTLSESCNKRSKFISHEDARSFVHTLGIKSQAEWKEFCRSGKKPANIPNGPDVFYKDNGWVSYGDWLGTGAVSKKLIKYRTFSEARRFTRKLGIKSIFQWRTYCKSGLKPIDIPVNPSVHYRLCGWISYSDFLNANMRLQQQKNSFMRFEEARIVARNLGFKSWDEWEVGAKNKKLPKRLPRFPNIEYASRWLGWRDWLGL